MARALLIANPSAARTSPAAINAVQTVLRGAGWSFEVVSTACPGDAGTLASHALSENVDVVAVLGGDGTTMQAASAMAGSEIPLALLPGGTGNLLAGNLRIPSNPAQAAKVMIKGHQRMIDLGKLEQPGRSQYFAVACGAGMDARVMIETPSEQKQRWGMMAYVATTLRLVPEIRSKPFLIEIDGQRQEIEAAMIMIANCREVIPRYVSLGTDIAPDDGWLDLVVFRADGFTGGVRAIWDLLRDARGTYGHEAFVGRARGREIKVQMAGGHVEQPVQLDGDEGGTTPFTARVIPDGLRVIVPFGQR